MDTIPKRIISNSKIEDDYEFLTLIKASGGSKSYRYTQIIDEAMLWSSFFKQKGLQQKDVVVIILSNSLNLYSSYIGALLSGLIPTMFAFPSPKFSEIEYYKTIEKLLDNANPKLIITYTKLQEKLLSFAKKKKIKLDVTVPDNIFTNNSQEIIVSLNDDPNDIAFLQYSSGTTGLKKGVAISHRALLWQIDKYAKAIQLKSNDTVVSWLPLYHDMGLIACFFLPLIKKIRLVSMSPFDWVKNPTMLIKAISDFKGTLCWLPNFSYNFMVKNVKESELNNIDLSTLRGVVNCSEPVMEKSHKVFLKRFKHINFSQDALCASYALAENTFAVTSGGFIQPTQTDCVNYVEFSKNGKAIQVNNDHPNSKILASSGQPLPDTKIEIISKDGQILPERHIGEIIIQSPCLLSEYYKNEKDTNKAIKKNKYHTGDLGYLANGELYVTGRKNDMIIIGGQNVNPQDIEYIINDIKGVIRGRVVAFGLSDEITGTEKLIILAETNDNNEDILDKIKKEIYDQVSTKTDVVPSDIQLFEHMWLVKSSSGKIARNENRQRYMAFVKKENLNRIQKETVDNGNLGNIEGRVYNCITRILKDSIIITNQRLGINTSLIKSGLIDSFAMVNLLAALEKEFNLSVPTSVVTDSSNFETINIICEVIRKIIDKSFNFSLTINVPQTYKDINMISSQRIPVRRSRGFWTLFYKIIFRLKGIKFGKGLIVKGPLSLRILSDPKNITIGNNVTLMPNVDIKTRENGKLIVHDGVKLDTMARLIVANNATLALGENVAVGMGTIINAGADIYLGRNTMCAGYCFINASDHNYREDGDISAQGYTHKPILIADGVWIAGHAFVSKGSRVGNGAIVGLKSVVVSDIPANSIVMGNPARVISSRSI